MQIITKIEIRKFRSIKSLTSTLCPSDLNIFVGQNDQGKSNVLRALNLFFNGETDVGQKFRFSDDYCYHANKGKGTSEEVKIDLYIKPRKPFKSPEIVKWSRQWKKDGSVVEIMTNAKNNEVLPIKNNVRKWLEKLRYRYVPAIKGGEYFNSLMGELHDVTNAVHEEILKDQGQGFISGIQDITKDITSELSQQIGIANTIQVPSDFRVLFSNLDFGSTLGENTYHLKQRGDGIKVRHIPVILKYMAEQERNISIPGFVKPDTIWGFEEPENNLELRYAFELAKSFQKYSKDIQIFLTTHSPAFYALDKTDTEKVKTFFVSQDSSGCTNLKSVSKDETDDIHEKMGLLPIITPYLAQVIEKQSEIDAQKKLIETLQDKVKCIVLTEDEDFIAIKTIFLSNNFNLVETEFLSYKGAGNLAAIKVIAKHYLEKKPHLNIIIHRDRDYLDDDEINAEKDGVEAIKCYFYTGEGVDVENEFLNPSHINFLYPKISKEQAEEIIFTSTTLVETDSKSRLLDKVLPTIKLGHSKKIEELNKLYDSDTKRYRYGKKVLSAVAFKIQKLNGVNANLLRKSDYISNICLTQLAAKIWPVA